MATNSAIVVARDTRVVSRPEDERWTKREKIRLAFEILNAYGVARWRMWRADPAEAASALRRGGAAAFGPASKADILLGRRLGSAVSRTLSILPTDSRCLVRALVLTKLLAARGVPSRVVIGAHLQPEFRAHAWVETGNVALLPPQDYASGRLADF